MFDIHISDPAREQRKNNFLRQYIFSGLPKLAPNFDSLVIPHFRAEEFLQIIERCDHFGVRIWGVEIFTDHGEVVSIEIAKTDTPLYFSAQVLEFCGQEHFSVCATFGVPDRLLETL